jgi:hypothetical protein
MSIFQPSFDGITPVTDTELDRAFDIYETDEKYLAMVGSANTITDYQPRQEALKQASRYALRKAINNVLKGRES